jgi:hypothetical protein
MRILPVVLALILLLPNQSTTADSSSRTLPELTMSLDVLRDKIEGGWAGQMIGVSFGAPTEFRFKDAIVPEGKLPKWTKDSVTNSLGQDDLYVDMTFAKVLDDKGLEATTEDFGAAFREAKYPLWHANLAARRNLKRGVPATLSGTPKYNVHANDIDFQIESDFIGLMTPAMPQAAVEVALRAGRVMNYGDGLYGGIFISCMYSAAFFESDPRKVVEAGKACMPPASPYAKLISDVLEWSKENPKDWITVWNSIDRNWNRREPCPEGALLPFNIDAKLNGAYVALGLLYGHGDIGETMRISTRCGQDSDCNPSTAAGIVGVMTGYKAIPDSWKFGIDEIRDKEFSFTDFSFRTIVDSNLKRAMETIRKNGGTTEAGRVRIKPQMPKPVKLEVWDDYGSPVERISVRDGRWHFSDGWKTPAPRDPYKDSGLRTSSEKGAEATVEFEGTGAILAGTYLPSGGKADIYLDGKFDRTVDAYPDEDNLKFNEAIWHHFSLGNEKHTVRLLVRGEPHGASKGSEIDVSSLIVFR